MFMMVIYTILMVTTMTSMFERAMRLTPTDVIPLMSVASMFMALVAVMKRFLMVIMFVISLMVGCIMFTTGTVMIMAQ